MNKQQKKLKPLTPINLSQQTRQDHTVARTAKDQRHSCKAHKQRHSLIGKHLVNTQATQCSDSKPPPLPFGEKCLFACSQFPDEEKEAT